MVSPKPYGNCCTRHKTIFLQPKPDKLSYFGYRWNLGLPFKSTGCSKFQPYKKQKDHTTFYRTIIIFEY